MLTETNVKRMASLFTGRIYSIKNLNGFHNHIYEVCGDLTFILRISEHQNDSATRSEIEFLKYLSKNGVPIAAPIASLHNLYVHTIKTNDKIYTVSAYHKADGKDFRTRGIDGKERLLIIGRTLGKIHKLSKLYNLTYTKKRRNWNENPHIIKAPGILREYNTDLLKRFNSYMSCIHNFPMNENSFGLVHGDFLFSNYFFDDSDNITIFDFDECEYSWYIYDIAVCMYYYLLGGRPKELDEKVEEAKDMFYYLALGYKQEFEIDMDCLRNMNLFFQLREYVLLSSILETSMRNLNGWSKDFVEGAVDRILTGKPFINVDFERIYSQVK